MHVLLAYKSLRIRCASESCLYLSCDPLKGFSSCAAKSFSKVFARTCPQGAVPAVCVESGIVCRYVLQSPAAAMESAEEYYSIKYTSR